ncbi:hypothetical protein [Streptomyces sp. BE20]|uniref:hypothetical protein n=1 Tax=Streptomyces sp. BE20 TaxID=3002525 RepID=UPI002E78771D|nr:hypothetical protein [Streptomyces sp. BE20]
MAAWPIADVARMSGAIRTSDSAGSTSTTLTARTRLTIPVAADGVSGVSPSVRPRSPREPVRA